MCKKINFYIRNIDFVGSHGQTIVHMLNDIREFKRSTLQIGEPAVIAYEIGCTVVSNFITIDMVVGGKWGCLVKFVYDQSWIKYMQTIFYSLEFVHFNLVKRISRIKIFQTFITNNMYANDIPKKRDSVPIK